MRSLLPQGCAFGFLLALAGCGRALAMDPAPDVDASLQTGETISLADSDAADGGLPDEAAEPCPSTCTRCGPGGRCEVDCSDGSCKGKTASCTPGRDCLVICHGDGVCAGTLQYCAKNYRCSTDCEGNGACTDLIIHTGPGYSASSVCLKCRPGDTSPACDKIGCALPADSIPGDFPCAQDCGDGGCGTNFTACVNWCPAKACTL